MFFWVYMEVNVGAVKPENIPNLNTTIRHIETNFESPNP